MRMRLVTPHPLQLNAALPERVLCLAAPIPETWFCVECGQPAALHAHCVQCGAPMAPGHQLTPGLGGRCRRCSTPRWFRR